MTSTSFPTDEKILANIAKKYLTILTTKLETSGYFGRLSPRQFDIKDEVHEIIWDIQSLHGESLMNIIDRLVYVSTEDASLGSIHNIKLVLKEKVYFGIYKRVFTLTISYRSMILTHQMKFDQKELEKQEQIKAIINAEIPQDENA